MSMVSGVFSWPLLLLRRDASKRAFGAGDGGSSTCGFQLKGASMPPASVKALLQEEGPPVQIDKNSAPAPTKSSVVGTESSERLSVLLTEFNPCARL